MKHFTLVFIWIALFLQVNKAFAQCLPPGNPFAVVNIMDNVGSITWDAPTHPCIDLETVYYEMEVGYFPFTPGMGQGLLVTPLFGTVHLLPFVDFGLQIWVRTVCNCVSESDCCVEEDIEGEWVMATITEVNNPPTCNPGPDMFCNSAYLISVATEEGCGQNIGEVLNYCDYQESEPANPCSISSFGGVIRWRKFMAPLSGSINIHVSGLPGPPPGFWPIWNDFGFRLIESNCTGEVIHCEIAITSSDTITVDGLNAGELYYIGVWNNNNFTPGSDNALENKLIICETSQSCIPPSDLSTSDATDVTVMVHWNANGSELWDLEYGDEGFSPGTGIFVEGIDDNPYMISGLDPLTTYDVYLKSICEPNAESEQIGPVTFETGTPTNIDESLSIVRSIFPNPTTGQLNIELNENGPVLVELFGMHGQCVLMQNQTTPGFSLDLAHLAKGMYSIRLTTNQQTVTEKVILK